MAFLRHSNDSAPTLSKMKAYTYLNTDGYNRDDIEVRENHQLLQANVNKQEIYITIMSLRKVEIPLNNHDTKHHHPHPQAHRQETSKAQHALHFEPPS